MRRLLPLLAIVPAVAFAQSATNPICPEEAVFYNPGDGEDIVVPRGYKVEVFARDLNFPTDVVFLGNRHDFKVLVLESGTGLPGRCNNNAVVPGIGRFDPRNPFTPGLSILTIAVAGSPARSASRPRPAAASSPTARRSASPSSTTRRAARCSPPTRTRACAARPATRTTPRESCG